MEHEKTTRCRKSQIFRLQPLTAQLLKIPAKSPVTGDLRSFPCNFTIFRSLTYEKPRLPDEVSECTSLQNQWPFLMENSPFVGSKNFPNFPSFSLRPPKFPAPGLNRRQVAWRWEPVVPGAHWISHPSPNCMKYWLAKKYINMYQYQHHILWVGDNIHICTSIDNQYNIHQYYQYVSISIFWAHHFNWWISYWWYQ